MTAPIAPTTGTSSTSSTTSSGSTPLGQTALNENDFLKMLVAQMKNQDPMSPMQGTEFATQLAQFSSVEQLIHLNDKFDTQTAATQQATNTTLGVSMVGHDVVVPGNGLDVTDGVAPQVTVNLPSDAAKITLQVIDSSGKVVATESFANAPAGAQTFDLSGANLDAGHYTYRASATAADGTSITGTTYSTAHVQGIAIVGGDIQLRVNGSLIPVSDVIEVLSPAVAPAAPAPKTTTTTTPVTTTTGAQTS